MNNFERINAVLAVRPQPVRVIPLSLEPAIECRAIRVFKYQRIHIIELRVGETGSIMFCGQRHDNRREWFLVFESPIDYATWCYSMNTPPCIIEGINLSAIDS
jgi:hypothetical protein